MAKSLIPIHTGQSHKHVSLCLFYDHHFCIPNSRLMALKRMGIVNNYEVCFVFVKLPSCFVVVLSTASVYCTSVCSI